MSEPPSDARLDRIVEVLCAYMQADFDARLPVEDPENTLDAVHAGINALGEHVGLMLQNVVSAEQRVRCVLDALPDPVAMLDPAGRVMVTNRTWERIMPASLRTPEDHLQALRAAGRPEAAAGIQRVLERTQPRYEHTHSFEIDGAPHWFTMVAAQLGAECGSAVVRHADVTAEHRTTLRLRAAEAELRRALARERLLSRELQHRVKNNLQLMRSLLYFTRTHGPVTPDALDELDAKLGALSAVNAALVLEDGESHTDVAEMLRMLARGLVDSQRFSLDLRIRPRPLPVPVSTAEAVCLVANEALMNAVKHGGRTPGRGRLQVGLDWDATDARLWIEDDGHGVDSTLERPHSGAGLRLMEALTDEVGGRLTVSGSGGTRVSLQFPTPHNGAQR